MTPVLLSLFVAVLALLAVARANVGPSTMAPESLLSRLLHKHFVHDPGATTAILASPDGGTTVYYIDMARLKRVIIAVAPSIVGGNGITLVRIFASTDAAGTGTATLVRSSGAIQLDNLDGASNSGGDCYRTEIHAQEIAQLAAQAGAALRYLTIEITTSTNTDEATVDVIGEGQDAYAAQSATVQA